MNVSRLVAPTAVAAVVVLAGSAVAVAAGDPTPTPPPRIAVVARGDGSFFADALAVGSVAGQLGAPVFTTPATSLASATAGALAGYGPELVIITGGTAAISADVEAAIERATGLPDDKVVRAAGVNRYETAAEIAAIFDELGIDPAFLPVGASAIDADTVDGKHASAFLGANAKARDADLLDGEDSTAFQPAGNYLTSADAAGFATAGPDGDMLNYLVELSRGQQATFATIGPLTYTAQCQDVTGRTAGTVRVTSSVSPWFLNGVRDPTGQDEIVGGGGPTDPGEVFLVSWSHNAAVPSSGVFISGQRDPGGGATGAEHTFWLELDNYGGAECTFAGTFFPHVRP